MINAKVIADSKNQFGNRITTLIVTMPRYILAEFNTHRMLSKNSASSRAIPFEKNLKSIQENPFIPIAWMKDHKGMQGTEYFLESDSGNQVFQSEDHDDLTVGEVLRQEWLHARDLAIDQANQLAGLGVTKQLVNRLLEPFMWHTVIVTGTEWENFFALRCPKYEVPFTWENETYTYRSKKDVITKLRNKQKEDSSIGTHFNENNELAWRKLNKGQADIHMMATAEAIWDAMNESIPKELKEGEWHIPFGDNIDNGSLMNCIMNTVTLGERGKDDLVGTKTLYKIKIATARCARVSYTVVGEEGKPSDFTKDIQLADNLAKAGHWSPFEHCARVMTEQEINTYISGKVFVERQGEVIEDISYDEAAFGWSGNFRGFIQYRKTFSNENITK